MKKILHIDASGRRQGSQSRQLGLEVVESIQANDSKVTHRDVSQNLPFLNDTMIGSYFTPMSDRTDEQKQAIALSDVIVNELMEHDTYVIGVPIYNFSMPAALKAWADLAARVGLTFQYGENGPEGLLEGKKAYIVVTSGGTQVGSDIDFLTPWLRHYLGFIGVKDVEIINASGLGSHAEETLKKARASILALAS
ncbi:MAG: FMN-dependent NADH-azoreductase [Arenicella sp.]